MSRQLTLVWGLERHMTADLFRKRFKAVNGLEPPSILFWHEESGKTIGQGYRFSHEKEISKTQAYKLKDARKHGSNWVRARGPRCEADLANNSRTEDDAMAMIRFFHTKRSVGIGFLGPEMIELANANLPIILDCAEQALGHCRVRPYDGELSLSLKGFPTRYVIPTLALKRPHFDFLGKRQYIERIVQQDIVRQAKILNISIPTGFYIKVTHFDDGPEHWVRTGKPKGGPNGSTGGALTVKNVEFLTNLKLQGFWSAGSLVSKGFGRIILPGGARGSFDE